MYQIFKLVLFYTASICFYLSAKNVQCQDTKYNRPSITKLYVGSNDWNGNEVLKVLKSLPVESQFNDHSIIYPDLNFNLPQGDLNDIEAAKTNQISEFVNSATNPIIAKWCAVDENGDFHVSFIRSRAMYSATDAEVIKEKASKSDHIDINGFSLINKTYIMVYIIDGVQTMEEYYDEQDNYNRKHKNYVPVTRDSEGYMLKYTIHLYKLDFNDEVEARLNENYWVDENNHDVSKVEAFKSAIFPVKYVSYINSGVNSNQLKDPNSTMYKIRRKRTMKDLFDALPLKLQQEAVIKLTDKVEDFQVKASIFQERPLTSKIGSKEGLALDQRFYVYEFRVDEKTKVKSKVRVGVVRATANISENRINATGNMKPSVFVQQGGKRLYQGMLLELMDDKGIGISAGYSYSLKDPSVAGAYFGVDGNISKLAYKFLKNKKMPGGIYLGAHFMFNIFNKINPGIVENSSGDIVLNSSSCSGNSFSFYFNLSKEVYFLRRGNLYLIPSFGVGKSNISINKMGGVEIDTALAKYYNWSTLCAHSGVGIGFNIKPKLSFIINPEFVIKTKHTDGYGNSIFSIYNEEMNNKWQNTFTNVGVSYSSILITLKLKYRI